MKKARRVENGGAKSVQQINQQDAMKPDSSSPSRIKINSSRHRKSKRRSVARTATPRSPRRELFVYDGTNLVGIIKVAVDGKCTTLDAHGKRLGIFQSQEAASAALNKQLARGRG